jgi:hypothetical protein
MLGTRQTQQQIGSPRDSGATSGGYLESLKTKE